jgi:hypothetical protein
VKKRDVHFHVPKIDFSNFDPLQLIHEVAHGLTRNETIAIVGVAVLTFLVIAKHLFRTR